MHYTIFHIYSTAQEDILYFDFGNTLPVYVQNPGFWMKNDGYSRSLRSITYISFWRTDAYRYKLPFISLDDGKIGFRERLFAFIVWNNNNDGLFRLLSKITIKPTRVYLSFWRIKLAGIPIHRPARRSV